MFSHSSSSFYGDFFILFCDYSMRKMGYQSTRSVMPCMKAYLYFNAFSMAGTMMASITS